MACVGGDETFGRFLEQPYPALLEQRLGCDCVNFGSVFCGVEALSTDRGLRDLVARAHLCILKAPDIPGQTNRFYRVHPRRNDRFVEPTKDLLSLYPDMDFTNVHFVGHLLKLLQAKNDARFETVRQELRAGWVRRCSTLLREIDVPVVLLWLRVRRHHDQAHELVPVDAASVAELQPFCASVVEMPVSVSGESDHLEDLLFGTLQQPMAEHMLGPSAHRAIANQLLMTLYDLNEKGPPFGEPFRRVWAD